MVNFIVSLVLGMIPEVLYLTLFVVYAKGIKEKKLKLFALLAAGYILLIMLCRFQFLFYITYIVYTFIILKLLYKANVCDFFVCVVALSYMTIISYFGYILLSWNYVLYYLVARITLYSIFLFRNKINILYRKYVGLWNRTENAKLKSITLRNSSLLILNILIISLYLIILLMLSF